MGRSVDGANIIELHRQKPKVSYLSYPDFDRKAHPALTGALVVPLRDFDVKYWDWSDSENHPILHRKEEFVLPDYPGREKFALRHSLPLFLADSPNDPILVKFIRDRIDLSRHEGAYLVAA